MHGAISSFLPTGSLSLSAEQYLVLAAPFLAVVAVWWLVSQTDRIVHHVFPDLEWEKSLGWLNIGAERRADAGLRWVGYAIYVVLVDSLYGIVWGAGGLPELDNWSDPWVMGRLALRIPALVICLGIWVLYLGCGLLPAIRARREAAAFKRFRAETEETWEERGTRPPSRIHSSLPKPRTNTSTESLMPDRTGRRQEGG